MLVRTLAVAAVASAIAVLALAASGSATSTKTLRFKDSQLAVTLDPRGAAPTIGTRLILTKALYNRARQFGKPAGARVGSADVICTVVSRGHAQCSVTAHVPDGEIVAMGVIRLTDGLSSSRFAIVGGAGAYASSSGTIDTRDVSQTHSLVTLNVRG